jgi:DNA-binding MarR family transcriptional regulator
MLNNIDTVPSKSMLAKTLRPTQSLSEELGMLIGKTRRMVWTNATRRLEQSGESILAWQVLACLIRAGTISQTEVATSLAQHPAGVSRLIDDLEKQGYVARRRDRKDRRRVHVEVTPRGRTRFHSILPEVVRGVDQVLEPLSGSERRVLRGLLRKVVLEDPECRSDPTHGGGAR